LAFSYRSCRHPHLHSFPTRRSSDLTMFAADIRYVLQRAKLLSELDDLTALYNTRGFAIAADRLFGQALRYTRPASVLMVDLDNLKAVNDSHGHDAGNRLLRHTANALRAELRYTD